MGDLPPHLILAHACRKLTELCPRLTRLYAEPWFLAWKSDLRFVNLARRVGLRHKSHVANAIGKAHDQREGRLGETLLDEMRRVQRKAWELLARTESEGDHRGSIVALREVRECLESLGEMLAKAETDSGGSKQEQHYDYGVLSDVELSTLEALISKTRSGVQ